MKTGGAYDAMHATRVVGVGESMIGRTIEVVNVMRFTQISRVNKSYLGCESRAGLADSEQPNFDTSGTNVVES